MGSIFGISDLPVSTITSAIKVGGGVDVPEPEYKIVPNPESAYRLERTPNADNFISKSKVHFSNPIIKMRNGFGKLMKHFSKVKL